MRTSFRLLSLPVSVIENYTYLYYDCPTPLRPLIEASRNRRANAFARYKVSGINLWCYTIFTSRHYSIRSRAVRYSKLSSVLDGLPKTDRERERPPSSLREYTYRAGSRSAQKIRSVAARQNARLFGYYVSAYRENPVTRSGGSRMTHSLIRGWRKYARAGRDVNIFILLYPCNSRVLRWTPTSQPESSKRFSCKSPHRLCTSTSFLYFW